MLDVGNETLGRPRAMRALKDLISSDKPAIMGLSETKLNARKWDSLRVVVGFHNWFSTNCVPSRSLTLTLWCGEERSFV